MNDNREYYKQDLINKKKKAFLGIGLLKAFYEHAKLKDSGKLVKLELLEIKSLFVNLHLLEDDGYTKVMKQEDYDLIKSSKEEWINEGYKQTMDRINSAETSIENSHGFIKNWEKKYLDIINKINTTINSYKKEYYLNE